jgi:serine/threonine protein kinase
MTYPDRPAYTTAVLNAGRLITDPDLKSTKPLTGKDGTPLMISGGVAVVYVFQDSGKNFAVKCWVSDIGDLRSHYQRVQAFLKTSRCEYFVGFEYVENGIIANSKKWPFLRMEWVGGKSLQEFVRDNITDQSSLALLAERYLAMTERLHNLGVAHGDLQGSNIKVVGSGSAIDIKLIDYDTLIVPSAHGQNAKALALPSYQHPLRGRSPHYTGKEDYFSELVIYLSILAVAEKPSLWRDYPKGDPDHDKEMLFVKEDFSSEKPTQVFKDLFSLSPLVKNLTLVLWNYTRMKSIELLLPLEDAVQISKDYGAHKPTPQPNSAFGSLIETTLSPLNDWLNDSAFITCPSQVSAIVAIQSTGRVAASFEDLLAANRLTPDTGTKPIANGIAVSPPRTKPPSIWPQIKVIMIGGCLALFGFFLLFLITATDNSRLSSIAPPQPVASTPSDEDAKVRRRKMWQADLQRRQQQSDATFAGLTTRFNQGLAAYEVESFNADVKIAERVRESLEAEINEYNSGHTAPARFQ